MHPMNKEPIIAQKGPYAIDVVAGKEYYWCACGHSKTQPFCDGSHKGSDLGPKTFKAEKSETIYFCGCKRTGNSPLCDGTHQKL